MMENVFRNYREIADRFFLEMIPLLFCGAAAAAPTVFRGPKSTQIDKLMCKRDYVTLKKMLALLYF